MWGVAGLPFPSLRQLSGDRSHARSRLLTPMEMCVEMEHSCSERVKGEKAPPASGHESWSLPRSSKGGQARGQGAWGSHGPKSWGRVGSEPSRSLGGSSRVERGVSVSTLDFYALSLLLSADLFGRRSCRGAANNGCSHFPAVRYLMTLPPQPPIFFFFFFSAWHSQLKHSQQSAPPGRWPLLLPFTSQGTPLCWAALQQQRGCLLMGG